MSGEQRRSGRDARPAKGRGEDDDGGKYVTFDALRDILREFANSLGGQNAGVQAQAGHQSDSKAIGAGIGPTADAQKKMRTRARGPEAQPAEPSKRTRHNAADLAGKLKQMGYRGLTLLPKGSFEDVRLPGGGGLQMPIARGVEMNNVAVPNAVGGANMTISGPEGATRAALDILCAFKGDSNTFGVVNYGKFNKDLKRGMQDKVNKSVESKLSSEGKNIKNPDGELAVKPKTKTPKPGSEGKGKGKGVVICPWCKQFGYELEHRVRDCGRPCPEYGSIPACPFCDQNHWIDWCPRTNEWTNEDNEELLVNCRMGRPPFRTSEWSHMEIKYNALNHDVDVKTYAEPAGHVWSEDFSVKMSRDKNYMARINAGEILGPGQTEMDPRFTSMYDFLNEYIDGYRGLYDSKAAREAASTRSNLDNRKSKTKSTGKAEEQQLAGDTTSTQWDDDAEDMTAFFNDDGSKKGTPETAFAGREALQGLFDNSDDDGTRSKNKTEDLRDLLEDSDDDEARLKKPEDLRSLLAESDDDADSERLRSEIW